MQQQLQWWRRHLRQHRSHHHNCKGEGEDNDKAVGEGGGGGGGDDGGWQPWQKGGWDSSIAVDCGGGVGNNTFHMPGGGEARRGEARGAPRQGYLCGNNWQLSGNNFPARWAQSQSGRGDGSGGGAKETAQGIQCWPQRRLVLRRWYCPTNNCGHPGMKRGDSDSKCNGNDTSILCGQPFDMAKCKCQGVHRSTGENPPLETPSLICFLPPPPPRTSGLEACKCGLGVKVAHVAARCHPLCPSPRPTVPAPLGVAARIPLLL